MTIWRSIKAEQKPAKRLFIEDGILYYYRDKGAVSCCDVDHLQSAWLRTVNHDIYWYLIDQKGGFVLIPESTLGIGLLRRYLSSWRGFNYDGLCRFDPVTEREIQLWPLQRVAAA